MSTKSNITPRLDFIGKPAPPGYVAGVGRGATGFTTRSDLGPARESTNRFAPGSSGAGHSRAHQKDNEDDEESEYLNEANFDEFAGYKGSIFSKEDPYDEEDKEADKIYEGFDQHMNERGKARELALQLEANRYKRPKIQHQFTDLIEDLKQVTEAEWVNLPESGDARNRKQRVGKIDKFTPIPESLLAEQSRLASGGETLLSIDPRTADHPDVEMRDEEDAQEAASSENRLLAMQNQSGMPGHLVNIGDMNECRSSIISSTLSAKTVGHVISTDREAYLGQLASSGQVKVEDNLEERRKQYQMMLKSADPDVKAKVYIMYIQLEEKAGKLSNARSLANKACKEFSGNVDLWLEAIRLHPRNEAKQKIIEAIRKKPTSLKLWLKAAELESQDSNKAKVYEKAREVIPSHPEIWRKSAEAESDPSEKDMILERAVGFCPNALDLWISLARLKPDLKSSKEVITRASSHNPTERSIWIEYAKLNELHERLKDQDTKPIDTKPDIDNIIYKTIDELVDQLKNKGVEIARDDWFKDAINAESEGYPSTAGAIIRRLIKWDLGHLSGKSLLDYLLEDAKKFATQNSAACARQIYAWLAFDLTPISHQQRESIWIAWAEFEQHLGSKEKLTDTLMKATNHCPSSETLWLMLINQEQTNSNLTEIIKEALGKNPQSEKLVLAAVELYCDRGSTKDARRILADASMVRESPKLLLRHAELERSLGYLDEAVRVLKVSVAKYRHPERDHPEKFYMLLGQIEEQRGNVKEAAEHYKMGLTLCKTNVDIWISLARLREKTETIPIARSTLEKARRFNDKVASLYVESAKLEIRAFLDKIKGSSGIMRRPNLAESLISEGIRKCKGQPEIETLESMQKLVKERKFAQCL